MNHEHLSAELSEVAAADFFRDEPGKLGKNSDETQALEL